jgi:hypothetical protein
VSALPLNEPAEPELSRCGCRLTDGAADMPMNRMSTHVGTPRVCLVSNMASREPSCTFLFRNYVHPPADEHGAGALAARVTSTSTRTLMRQSEADSGASLSQARVAGSARGGAWRIRWQRRRGVMCITPRREWRWAVAPRGAPCTASIAPPCSTRFEPPAPLPGETPAAAEAPCRAPQQSVRHTHDAPWEHQKSRESDTSEHCPRYAHRGAHTDPPPALSGLLAFEHSTSAIAVLTVALH